MFEKLAGVENSDNRLLIVICFLFQHSVESPMNARLANHQQMYLHHSQQKSQRISRRRIRRVHPRTHDVKLRQSHQHKAQRLIHHSIRTQGVQLTPRHHRRLLFRVHFPLQATRLELPLQATRLELHQQWLHLWVPKHRHSVQHRHRARQAHHHSCPALSVHRLLLLLLRFPPIPQSLVRKLQGQHH